MNISVVLNNKWAHIGAAATASFIGGAGVGYIIGKRRHSPSAEFKQQALDFASVEDSEEVGRTVASQLEVPKRLLIADEENQNEPFRYDLVTVEDELNAAEEELASREIPSSEEPDDEERQEMEALTEIIVVKETEDEPYLGEIEEPEEIHNVFATSGDDWDYEEEKKIRTPVLPYIIHQDEYLRDEEGFEQCTLTYYEGDQILANEEDVPLYDQAVVGDLRFGHGSNDNNVVYVRNVELKKEYEILRHSGHFSQEVEGLEQETAIQAEIVHADRHQRFRPSD